MPGDDMVVCLITSKPVADRYATTITQTDFEWGGLAHDSNARANIIFTANQRLVLNARGQLKKDAMDAVVAKVARLLGIR
jgi:mRNA interferase MazF